MWLDRFSGISTPTESSTSHSRTQSPNPRRTSHLAPSQRSGLGLTAGASSLSLALSSNDSNLSLSTPSRITNGSSLKQEQRASPIAPDPLKILRSILGTSSADRTSGGPRESDLEGEKPQVFDADLDFGEQSLEEYANGGDEHVKSLSRPTALDGTSTDEREKYLDLHDAINGCDEALRSVESYLTDFENELGSVSSEIEDLQTRSTQLTAKLENRRKVERLLGAAVEEISISPAAVRSISERAVDEKWIEALDEIESRSTAMEKDNQLASKATEDVKPLLEDLKAKALERIRDFIVAQIKALRLPDANAQIIQQQKLVKYKALFSFLAKNSPVLSDEIGQAYVYTMKWYYLSNFTRYQQSLEKLQLHMVDPTEVLGGDSKSARRNKSTAPQYDALSLGRRAEVLKTRPTTALPAYSVEADKSHHYLETPFYSFNLALIDNVCSEFSVATELFSMSKNSVQEVTRKAVESFEPTFALGHAFTKQLIDTNNSNADCLGILLCVRLNQHFAFQLQRRKVPIADSYINGTNMLLWPRFQMLMDSHCESLKNFPTSANANMTTTTATGNKTPATTSVAPHPLTQKVGHFLHALLSLSTEPADADEPVAHSLARLRSEYEAVMTRLASSTSSKKQQQNRFLFYNYSLVTTIIADVRGKLANEVRARFELLIQETMLAGGEGGGRTNLDQ